MSECCSSSKMRLHVFVRFASLPLVVCGLCTQCIGRAELSRRPHTPHGPLQHRRCPHNCGERPFSIGCFTGMPADAILSFCTAFAARERASFSYCLGVTLCCYCCACAGCGILILRLDFWAQIAERVRVTVKKEMKHVNEMLVHITPG